MMATDFTGEDFVIAAILFKRKYYSIADIVRCYIVKKRIRRYRDMLISSMMACE